MPTITKIICSSIILLLSFGLYSQVCVPVRTVCTYQGCNLPSSDTTEWAKHWWYYDMQGRLITDSTSTSDRSMMNLYTTEHYRYSNDSVFGDDNKGNKTLMVLNKCGFPIEMNIYFSSNAYAIKATYLSDTILQRVAISSFFLNDTSLHFYTVIDDIMYSDGNIISYKWSLLNDRRITKRESGFDYYTGRVHNPNFASNDKMRGLRIWAIGNHFSIQPFCRNLLKSETQSYQTSSYDYVFDGNQNITEIKKTSFGKRDTSFYQWKFDYSCK